MNTKLEKLFEMHDFSAKDRHDFMQIYALLPNQKKIRVVENFSEIVKNIGSLKKELLLEQEILFGSTLSNIEEKLKVIQKKNINAQVQSEMQILRSMI